MAKSELVKWHDQARGLAAVPNKVSLVALLAIYTRSNQGWLDRALRLFKTNRPAVLSSASEVKPEEIYTNPNRESLSNRLAAFEGLVAQQAILIYVNELDGTILTLNPRRYDTIDALKSQIQDRRCWSGTPLTSSASSLQASSLKMAGLCLTITSKMSVHSIWCLDCLVACITNQAVRLHPIS